MTLKEFCGLLRKTSTYFIKSWELQSDGAIRLTTHSGLECCPIQAVALMVNPQLKPASHTYRTLIRELGLSEAQMFTIIYAVDNDPQTAEHSELRKELFDATNLPIQTEETAQIHRNLAERVVKILTEAERIIRTEKQAAQQYSFSAIIWRASANSRFTPNDHSQTLKTIEKVWEWSPTVAKWTLYYAELSSENMLRIIEPVYWNQSRNLTA